MARFTKTKKDGNFMGWDEARQGAECSEAKSITDLYAKMNVADAKIFQSLSPGQVYTTRDFIEYFREF